MCIATAPKALIDVSMKHDARQNPEIEKFVGRTEISLDVADPLRIQLLAATLDRIGVAPWASDSLPPLAHWTCFLPDLATTDLAIDGHAKRTASSFLPADNELPRRMWAGSRVEFLSSVPLGAVITRRSTIKAVQPKAGRSGPLLFATVLHEIALADGTPAIREEQDIVYRPESQAAATSQRPDHIEYLPETAVRQITPDSRLLFRYSALTFNGHRIHYDADYVREVEGYPGIIVHGPLVATLLLDTLLRAQPKRAVTSFAFRGLSPAFANEPLALCLSGSDDSFEMECIGPCGTTMIATATLADRT